MTEAKKFQSNRDNIRAQVIPTEVRGLIQRDNAGHEPLLLWDLAVNGLGIWTSAEIKKGEKVKVTLGKPTPLTATCTVIWAEKQSNGGYRAGLHADDVNAKIAELYKFFCEKK